MKKGRRFSREFKMEAVRLDTKHGYKVCQAAESFRIHENLLGGGERSWPSRVENKGVSGAGHHEVAQMDVDTAIRAQRVVACIL